MKTIRKSHEATLGAGFLHEQPIGTAHYRIVILCFLAWIFDFYDLVLYSFLLVPIARELHLQPVESSFALGFSLFSTALGGVFFGFAGDRFGRKPAILATVLLYGIGTLLCAFAHGIGELLLYRSLTGLGIGGEWAAGQSLVAETVPARHRARYAAYVQLGAPLGVLGSALVGGYVAPAIGWRLSFALGALPALMVAGAVMRWLPESDVWLAGGRRVRWPGRAELVELAPYRETLIRLFVILLVCSDAYWFTYSWMPGYLELSRGLGPQGSGRLMLWMQLGAIVGYGSFGVIADRCGRRPTFCVFAGLMALGLLPPTVLWKWSAPHPLLLELAMVVAGLGTGLWSGAAPIISELLPTWVRNTALGVLLNVTRGLQFFTPLIVTALAPRIGFGATLSLGALCAALGGVLIWTLPETRGRHIGALD